MTEQPLSIIEEQSIKAARFAHRLLLTICLTALLFTITPVEIPVYDKVEEELNALLRLDFNEIQLKAALRTNIVKKHISDIDIICRKYGYNYIPDGRNNFFSINPRYGVIHNITLDEIFERLNRTIELNISVVKINDHLAHGIEAFLKKYNRAQNPDLGRIVSIYHNSDKKLAFDFNGKILYSSATYRITDKDKDQICRPFNFVVEIFDDDDYRQLLKLRMGPKATMPNLNKVWNQIRFENPRDALEIIARKDVPEKAKEIHFLGFSIPQKLLSLALPFLILAFSWNLFVHVRYLLLLACNNANILKYPWIALMPGFEATIGTIVSVLLIPALTTSMLLLKLPNSSMSLRVATYTMGAISIYFIIRTSVLLLELKRIRSISDMKSSDISSTE